MAKQGFDETTEGRALISQLAEKLGVDLKDTSQAVATDKRVAEVRCHDNSFYIKVWAGNEVEIETPRVPGIKISLVDPNNRERFPLAPEGAIYVIRTYRNLPDVTAPLNGDIATIYINQKGLLLDNAARERAKNLPRLPPQ